MPYTRGIRHPIGPNLSKQSGAVRSQKGRWTERPLFILYDLRYLGTLLCCEFTVLNVPTSQSTILVHPCYTVSNLDIVNFTSKSFVTLPVLQVSGPCRTALRPFSLACTSRTLSPIARLRWLESLSIADLFSTVFINPSCTVK